LGGEDFDSAMVAHCVQEFKRKHKHDISSNSRAMRRLRTACERAKRNLSSAAQSVIEVDALFEGIDFNTTMTRAKFEELCMLFFKRAMEPVERALQDSKLSKSQIHEVVLVGGSTRIPKLQSMLSDFFNGKEPNKGINPDEAVAYGATAQAANLSGVDKINGQEIIVLDVTPLSLGVKMAGDIMSVIIKRGTTVPCHKSETYSTFRDNQPAVTIEVYEGERRMVKDNNLLGTFNLEIPPAPRGVPQIEISFDVDTNGILNVTAVDKSTQKKHSITIKNESNKLSKEDIEKMVKEAELHRDEDEKNAQRIEAVNGLESFCYQVKTTLDDEKVKPNLSESDRTNILDKSNELISWLESGRSTITKEECDTRRKELEDIYMPVITKMYQQGAGGPGGMPDFANMAGAEGMPNFANMGGSGSDNGAGPKIEEVD